MKGKAFLYIVVLFIFTFTVTGYSAFLEDQDIPDTGDYTGDIREGLAVAGDPQKAFDLANSLYIDGEFEDAIMVYEQVAVSGYSSTELYYNLGNAYYRSNRIPAAILNYERALLLAPGDDDIKFNLELARMHVRDRIGELPGFFLNRWWTGARDLMSEHEWAILSISLFIAMLLFLGAFLMASSPFVKKIFFWLSVVMFIVSALSLAFGIDRRNHIRNYSGAIVFAPAVSVKSSPDMHSADLFIIHEGTRVWVEDALGEWYEVRLSDGNKGWLRKETVEMIKPGADGI